MVDFYLRIWKHVFSSLCTFCVHSLHSMHLFCSKLFDLKCVVVVPLNISLWCVTCCQVHSTKLHIIKVVITIIESVTSSKDSKSSSCCRVIPVFCLVLTLWPCLHVVISSGFRIPNSQKHLQYVTGSCLHVSFWIWKIPNWHVHVRLSTSGDLWRCSKIYRFLWGMQIIFLINYALSIECIDQIAKIRVFNINWEDVTLPNSQNFI